MTCTLMTVCISQTRHRQTRLNIIFMFIRMHWSSLDLYFFLFSYLLIYYEHVEVVLAKKMAS